MEKELLSLILEKAFAGGEANSTTGYERYTDKNVFIRTVTMSYTGRIESVDGMCLTLSNACWIADTGRFTNFLIDTNKANEVEPFKNNVSVGLGGIIDITEVDELPRDQK